MKSISTGIIIQARMNSKRFPGKSLYTVNGKPMLAYLIDRMGLCNNTSTTVVATSCLESDDSIALFCEENNIQCFRGPLEDVALRFKQAIEFYQFDSFVRINGDSPLMDPAIVDKAVQLFHDGLLDIVTNTLHRTFPKGQSVEVINSTLYCENYRFMNNDLQREHVTRYFYENAGNFKIFNMTSEGEFGDLQLSVDTVEDMQNFQVITDLFKRPHTEYGYLEIIELSRVIATNGVENL